MAETENILARIDDVIKANKRSEWLFCILLVILFLVGIGSIICAIISKEYVWTTPSLLTTCLLKWPLKEIRCMRIKNIALATAPMLIDKLPPKDATKEIQKMLTRLFDEGK
jgi:hypothetical protein